MNTTDELFCSDVGKADSPRLAWMKKHGVITYRTPFDPFDYLAGVSENAEMTLNQRRDWFADETAQMGDTRIGIGMSEDEALAELAKRRGIPLWNEEQK